MYCSYSPIAGICYNSQQEPHPGKFIVKKDPVAHLEISVAPQTCIKLDDHDPR